MIFDGKKFETSRFTEKTKISLEALRFIEDEIKRTKIELMALESARDAYLKAIHAECDENDSSGEGPEKMTLQQRCAP